MSPGVHLGMDRAQYEALPFYNQSVLTKWIELGELPSEFSYWRAHRHEEKESECLRIGRGLDCLQLDGAIEFAKRFAAVPEDAPKRPNKAQIRAKKPSKETLEAIAYWAKFNQDTDGKTILSLDEYLCVCQMANALIRSDSVSGVFNNSTKAVLVASIFGFECKGEVDLWEEKTEHIWDLKALRDVSPKGFAKAFFDFGYDIQATFYIALARALKFEKRVFNFVCVKNEAPYTVAVHSFSPYDNADHAVIAAQASARIGVAIQELDRRIKADDFRDDQDWRLVDIPAWRLRQAKFEMEAV